MDLAVAEDGAADGGLIGDCACEVGIRRVSRQFFMNRFRKPRFVKYDGRICAHKSLLSVILHD
jgi:hypothetical protein